MAHVYGTSPSVRFLLDASILFLERCLCYIAFSRHELFILFIRLLMLITLLP